MLNSFRRLTKLIPNNSLLNKNTLNTISTKNFSLFVSNTGPKIRGLTRPLNRTFSTETTPPNTNYNENDSEALRIMKSTDPNFIRNIAIIAHVDHGKTTLVDCMLRQSGITLQSGQSMDSNELEQERGITILSKCTGLSYKGYKINIVDTPGHQDFGGEVERIMSMVDGVCLVVCAIEGPMPQTRFVLSKALQRGLKPIVVINKSDRTPNRIGEIENEVFDLFCNLNATDEQLDYTVIYASARGGWAVKDYKNPKKENVYDLLDSIIEKVPKPEVNLEKDFTMLVSQIESNKFFGKMLIGRISSGILNVGDKILALDSKGDFVEGTKVHKLIRRIGMNQIEINQACAGDIVSVAGFEKGTVTHTLNTASTSIVIPSIPIDPPMISVTAIPNDSPLFGKEGTKISSQELKDRFLREQENDVSLRIAFDPTQRDIIQVFGRGDLHLGILLERMRREGFEMALTPPQVIFKEENGVKLEPIEEITLELGQEFINEISDIIQLRKGIVTASEDLGNNKGRLVFEAPSRGLFGFRPFVITLTKGNVIINSRFKGYEKFKGSIKRNTRGCLLSCAAGKATQFALKDVETKGPLYISPGTEVYNGMVIGEMTKDGEIEVNPCKEKPATNIRAAGKDEYIRLTPVRSFTLEEALVMLRSDELLEVTPKSLRMRKRILDSATRRKITKNTKKDEDDADF